MNLHYILTQINYIHTMTKNCSELVYKNPESLLLDLRYLKHLITELEDELKDGKNN